MKDSKENFKKDGFDGQRAIILPRSILNKFCVNNKLINRCYITDIGYYPKAKLHFRERLHGAEQNILIYCVDGRGSIKINKVTYEIVSGDFIFIPKGQAHSYKTKPENPWTIYWCHFKGEQADEIISFSANKHNSLKSSIPFLDARIELFDSVYQTLESGYSFDNLSSVNLKFPLFLSSFVFSDKLEKSKHVTEDLIELSLRFMQNNLDQTLTLEMIAQSINFSASHFSAIFKKRTGFPPIEYLNHLKIQKACQFLQFTPLRIKEIGTKVGLDDQYYFSRLFNKIMGMSPSEYRDQRNSSK